MAACQPSHIRKTTCSLCQQKFACNGTVIEHPEYGEVIQLQGDQRKNICQFLIEVSWKLVGRVSAWNGLCITDLNCYLTCRLTWQRRSSSKSTAFRSCQQSPPPLLKGHQPPPPLSPCAAVRVPAPSPLLQPTSSC